MDTYSQDARRLRVAGRKRQRSFDDLVRRDSGVATTVKEIRKKKERDEKRLGQMKFGERDV